MFKLHNPWQFRWTKFHHPPPQPPPRRSLSALRWTTCRVPPASQVNTASGRNLVVNAAEIVSVLLAWSRLTPLQGMCSIFAGSDCAARPARTCTARKALLTNLWTSTHSCHPGAVHAFDALGAYSRPLRQRAFSSRASSKSVAGTSVVVRVMVTVLGFFVVSIISAPLDFLYSWKCSRLLHQLQQLTLHASFLACPNSRNNRDPPPSFVPPRWNANGTCTTYVPWHHACRCIRNPRMVEVKFQAPAKPMYVYLEGKDADYMDEVMVEALQCQHRALLGPEQSAAAISNTTRRVQVCAILTVVAVLTAVIALCLCFVRALVLPMQYGSMYVT